LRLQLACTLDGARDVVVFSHAFPADSTRATGFFQARFHLVGIKQDDGIIELGWRDGRTELDRDLEIAIEVLCDHVAGAYERIRSRPERFLRSVS
jgi:hypothetical protein